MLLLDLWLDGSYHTTIRLMGAAPLPLLFINEPLILRAVPGSE